MCVCVCACACVCVLACKCLCICLMSGMAKENSRRRVCGATVCARVAPSILYPCRLSQSFTTHFLHPLPTPKLDKYSIFIFYSKTVLNRCSLFTLDTNSRAQMGNWSNWGVYMLHLNSVSMNLACICMYTEFIHSATLTVFATLH